MDASIDPVLGAASAQPINSVPQLGRDDFLRLLVAKLEHQDPLSPADDTEFVAELATFSSLEQLISANGNLETIGLLQEELLNSQALGLIGKEVVVEAGDRLRIADGSPDTILYEIPRQAETARLEILDAGGNVVRTIELERTPGGRLTLDWDGKDDQGRPLDDGDYRVRTEVKDAEGEPISIALFRSLPVDGASLEDGQITLVSRGEAIYFDMILEIRAGSPR